MTLPAYFTPPAAGETFGRLRLVEAEGARLWLLEEADPQAVIMAKRLFPGSSGRGPGVAKFPAGPRQMQDLLWYLQRWPMRIESPEAFAALRGDAAEILEARAAFRTAPAAVELPLAFTGTLRDYQEAGVAWLLGQRKTLLADEMGLGKTVQAIAALVARGVWPALVVVPPHLVRQWEKMLDAFLDVAEARPPDLFNGRDRTAAMTRATLTGQRWRAPPPAQIYLCHYLLLQHKAAGLCELGIPTVVFDEMQELRHRGTGKYDAALVLAERAEQVWGLSGTPIYNRAQEIWSVANVLERHCLGDLDSFTREYCGQAGGVEVASPRRLGAVLAREGLMLRRRQREVRPDMPPKHRLVQAVDGDAATYHQLIKKAVSAAQRLAEATDGLERGRLVREIDAVTRHATGRAKAPAAAAFIRSLVEAGEAVVVFAWHHDVVDAICDGLTRGAERRVVKMTGRESLSQKAGALRAFLDEAASVLVMNLRSAAGVDGLQARDPVVVFAELDWSPAVHAQCEDRAHRDGMTGESTLCYYLVSEDGSDPEMQDRLGLKIRDFRELMHDPDDQGEPDDVTTAAPAIRAHLDRIAERLRAEAGA